MSNRPLFYAARFLLACMATAAVGFAVPAQARQKEKTAAHKAAHKAARSHHAVRHAKPRLDTSDRKQVGQASVYAGKFAGRKMADGTRMNPNHDTAASKTLPLGSKARVTNLETGKSTVVTIRDRGPHVKGRIVDLSPSTARSVGITPKKGVAKVEVVPIPGAAAPGGLKPGAVNPAAGVSSGSRR